jgi:hypothetical protein
MPKRQKGNADHAQRHNTPTINNEAIANHLEALLTPAIFAMAKILQTVRITRASSQFIVIEEAFYTVKRLLGLSYLWTGSINGVKLQIWATWLFYAVLVDLADAVADELSLPFDRISLEMIYRGLYHFSVAYDKGKADDPVKYFADPSNQDLGVVKALRKPVVKLDLSPFPAPS